MSRDPTTRPQRRPSCRTASDGDGRADWGARWYRGRVASRRQPCQCRRAPTPGATSPSLSPQDWPSYVREWGGGVSPPCPRTARLLEAICTTARQRHPPSPALAEALADRRRRARRDLVLIVSGPSGTGAVGARGRRGQAGWVGFLARDVGGRQGRQGDRLVPQGARPPPRLALGPLPAPGLIEIHYRHSIRRYQGRLSGCRSGSRHAPRRGAPVTHAARAPVVCHGPPHATSRLTSRSPPQERAIMLRSASRRQTDPPGGRALRAAGLPTCRGLCVPRRAAVGLLI